MMITFSFRKVNLLEMSGTSGFIYRIADWLMKLAIVNLLWIFFTVAGLLLFGFYPAWIAVCRLISLWKDGKEPPIVKTFWSVYRQIFIKSNLVAFLGGVFVIILIVNLNIISFFEGFIFYFFSTSTVIVLIGFAVWMIIFGLAAAEKIKVSFTKESFIEPVKRMVLAPGKTLLLIVGIFAVYFLNGLIPGLLPVYSVSLIGFICVSLFTEGSELPA